jgi:hypothetical protein
MEEFAKKKGKELTRGSKQIAKENVETINFYRNMILVCSFPPTLYIITSSSLNVFNNIVF